MKTKVTVNIDTLEFSVYGERNSFDIPNTTSATVVNSDGEILDRYQNRVELPGKYRAHSLHVRTLHSGAQLRIEGSPYAFIYGQNVFTGSNLRFAVRKALTSVLDHFHFQPTAEQEAKWSQGKIDLHRVDLVVNFALSSEAQCQEVLTQLKRQLIEQQSSIKISGTTVYWTPQDGKEHSIGVYAKGPQMRRMKRYDGCPHKERLFDQCENILRVEVRLREAALKRLSLTKACNWTKLSPRTVFSQYMRRLRIYSITSGPVKVEELDALPHRRLRPVLALHKAGVNLRHVYSQSTLRRHQADLKELNIDLKCPNQPEGRVQDLTRILSPKRAIRRTPAWIQEKGLAPKRNRVTKARTKSRRQE